MGSTLKRDLKGRFVKGSGAFWKGKHLTAETREKLSLSHLGKTLNERSRSWKGNDVKKSALHFYVRRHLPQPEFCEFCKVKKSKHLANITGVYERPFHNWKYLCVSCHRKYDYRVMGVYHAQGKPLSEEQKRKISLVHKGKKWSAESIHKRSETVRRLHALKKARLIP